MQNSLTKRGFGSCIEFWALALACCTTAAAQQSVPMVASLAPKGFVTVSDESQPPSAAAPAPDTLWSNSPAPQPAANENSWSSVAPKPESNTNLWSQDSDNQPPAPAANLWSSNSGGQPGGNCSSGNCGPGGNSGSGCNFSLPRYQPPPESAWYTRLDYFHWTERQHAKNLLDESGPVYTLGYTRTWGEMRVRAEFFGGVVQYHGAAQFISGNSVQTTPLDSHTAYYGGRFEYDFFCNLRNHPNVQLVFGLGIRSWDRNLPSATINGLFVQGYNETWFTMYPYIGFESRHDPTKAWEFYGRARVGVTAWNFNYASLGSGVMLYPRPGATALLEEGVRIDNWLLTGYVESFGWARSGSHDGFLQPQSTLLMAGIKAGYSY